MKATHRKLLYAAFGSTSLDISPLSGGLFGRCYRVMGPGLDAAVRLPGQRGFRLSSATEQALVARAASAGLSPPLIATPPELELIATQYLQAARPWTAADARAPRNIARLCALLRRLHALNVELDPFACSAAAGKYADSAAARGALSTEQWRWRDELLESARDFEARYPPSVLCHNDLVPSNVLDDGALWLVDFEFAVRAAPILDLASFAAFSCFEAPTRGRLLGAYYGSSGLPFDDEQFVAAIRLVRLLAYFWLLADPGPSVSRHDVGAFAESLAAMLR